MASKLLIKRGDGAPVSGSIDEYELVYDYTNNQLYTKVGSTITAVGGGGDADTLDGINSTSFLRSDAADTATGLLTLNGGVHILSGTGGGKLRIKRNSGSTDGDDIVDLHLDDFGLYVDLDNDNDSDQSEFKFRYKTGGSFTNLLAFNSSSISYKGNTIPTISNMANDRIVTGNSSTTIRGESNVTINSSNNLTIGGGGQLTLTGGTNAVINVNSTADSFIEKDSGTNLYLANNVQDGDLLLRVNDGGTNKTAISIDASDNARVKLPYDNQRLAIGAGQDLQINHDGSNTYIDNYTGQFNIINNQDDGDIIFKSDNGSGGTTNYMVIDGGATAIDLLQDTRVKAGKKLFLDGGGNSYIWEESADNVMFYIGGRNMLRLHEGNGEVVVNDSQLNTDFRVESDGRDKMLFVDASADIVAINGSGLGGRFNITESTSSGNPIAMRIRGYDHSYILSTQNSSATGNPEQFRIEHYDGNVRMNSLRGSLAINEESGQNVGINTASPSYKLDVAGDARVQDVLYLEGNGDQMLRFSRSGADVVSIEQDSSQLYFYNRTTSKVLFLMSETGSAKLGYNSNPELELRNTATSAGSGSSLTFGHSQSGTNSVARISSYLTDGSQANRAGHLRFWTRQGGTESLAMQLQSNNYLRLYQNGDTSDYLELYVNDTHAFYHHAHGTTHRFLTDHGHIEFGPQNSGWGHINTDRASFYFNKRITVDEGIVQSYDEDLVLRRANSSAHRIDITGSYTRVIVNNNEEFRVDASGALTSGQHRVTSEYQVNSNGTTLRRYVGTWTSGQQTHDVIYNAYASNLGDYVYLKASGNSTTTHGMLINSDKYLFWGRDNLVTGDIDNSATAPMTDVCMRVDENGNGLFDGDVVAYSTTIASDARLKENVKDLNYGLKDVLDIRPVSFDWIDKRDGKHDIGVIAQEIEKIIPEVVVEVDTLNSEDTHKTVDYAKLTSVLIKAVQEQQQQINDLKEKLNG
tara:strand:+ start:526 stop:3453 length:2928 start_codon:yes stop_codon:yes gene_type:complete